MTVCIPIGQDGREGVIVRTSGSQLRKKLRASKTVEGFRIRPGYLLTVVRAISARINQNYDAWPADELKKSYTSFLGKPIFCNHTNDDPRDARGRIIAARYCENGDDKYIECIMEIDAQRFPILAKEIIEGGLDSVSMGAEAGFTLCSFCNNKATDLWDMCDHVKYHKGEKLIDPKTREAKLVYETCHNLGFFELSYVFDPADETAVVSKVMVANKRQANKWGPTGDFYDPEQEAENVRNDPWTKPEAWDDPKVKADSQQWHMTPEQDLGPSGLAPGTDTSLHHYIRDQFGEMKDMAEAYAFGKPPWERDDISDRTHPKGAMRHAANRHYAYGEVEAPESIDTLRDEDDGLEDDFHHYVESPPELQDPDLGDSHRLDREQESDGLDFDRRVEDMEGLSPDGGQGDPSDMRQDPAARQFLNANEDWSGPTEYTVPDKTNHHDEDDWSGHTEYKIPTDREASYHTADLQHFLDWLQATGQPADEQSANEYIHETGAYPDEISEIDNFLYHDISGHLGSNRSPVINRFSENNERRAMKGNTMGKRTSLADRGRVASRGRVRHHADDSGHTDGGPFGEENQGEQEEVYLTQTPGAEAVSAPTADEHITNTENNLVARIRRASAAGDSRAAAYYTQQLVAFRRYADEGETAKEVNPPLSGTDVSDCDLKGDFESANPNPGKDTQPKDASVQAFRAFDRWLANKVGRRTSANLYANEKFVVSEARRFAQANQISPQVLFPTLGNVLRQAKKAEVERRAAMRRRADESLDVAAPNDRIDVEKPVKNVTDADAQASQFDKGDFGGNASDNLADPDQRTDTAGGGQWAPDVKPDTSKASSVRTADAVMALRLAEGCIKVGLLNERDKYNALAQFTRMRAGQVMDRINLIDAIVQVQAQKKVASGVRRGAVPQSGIPAGLMGAGGMQRAASTRRIAENHPENDLAMWV